MVIGNTRPGNNTTLRTGTMIRASGGNGGMDVAARFALSSAVPKNWASVTQRSRFLQRDKEASVGYGVAHRAVAPGWKPHAALEPTLRELETMNDGSAQLARKDARPRHHEIIAIEDCFDPVGVDSRQGDQHKHLAFGFQHIDRRLPGRQPGDRAERPKQLAIQPLRTRQHLARLRPHPVTRKSLVHRLTH